jgi:DNA-binding NarL/FixJ family response regulator
VPLSRVARERRRKKTVETHIRDMFRKLDAHSRVEMARAIERAQPITD